MAIELDGQYDENAEANSYDPIPAGEYRARIIQADKEEVSRNRDCGECLNLTWEIESGPYDGRLVWQRLNLWGLNMTNNDQVVRIANSQFAEIREATGKKTPRDSDELLHIPCLIKVAVTQDKNKEYDPRNEVKRVKALPSASALSTSPQQPIAGGGQAAATGSTPWPSSTAPANEPPF